MMNVLQGLIITEDIFIGQFEGKKFIRILMNNRNLWTAQVEKLLIFIDIELGYYEGFSHQPPIRQVPLMKLLLNNSYYLLPYYFSKPENYCPVFVKFFNYN